MENLGSSIQKLRTSGGLSQRALALAAGVSNGTISLIENRKLDPTVGQLKKILTALDVSMAEFFETDTKPKESHFYTAEDLVEIGRGDVSYKLISRPDRDQTLQIMNETYAPGSDTGPTLLSHDGEEGGIIISGELEVFVQDQSRTLKAGDAYQFSSHLPHRFRNTGQTECRLITACTPPSF
jgi:transcriptional regulator with XRE-family HTH domain